MFLSTTTEYDATKYEEAGLVIASHVEAISLARSWMASFAGTFGNKSNLLTKKLDDTMKGIMNTLIENAQKNVPDAVGIVGVKISLSQMDIKKEKQPFMTAVVTGTVLKPRATMGGQKKSRTRKNRK